MANVLVGATGSVAAVRVPALYDALTADGHAVKVVATDAAAYFFDPAALGRSGSGSGSGRESKDGSDFSLTPTLTATVYRDADEWPGDRYVRDAPVLHIELRKWADLFLIAPLDANTLAKLAVGLCDNCLTCVWRAWDPARPVVLAPAMNTLMWEHPLTRRQLGLLCEGQQPMATDLDLPGTMAWINQHCPGLRIVPPISKRLACDDVGIGAMAEVETIVGAVGQVLTK